MQDSYRQEFSTPTAAQHYDSVVFRRGSYASMLWAHEKRLLGGILERLTVPTAEIAALDFACGSGRVLSYLEGRIGVAVGVDVSASMLEIAATHVRKSRLVCADITSSVPQGHQAEEKVGSGYDIITAFRFFLNAEPQLRFAAMTALRKLLKSGDSRLVFTVQAHVPSHKSISKFVSRARLRARDGKVGAEYMTEDEVLRLVRAAGLELEQFFGYDLVSGASCRVLPPAVVERIERVGNRQPLIQKLGAHRLYVVRPA